MERVLPRSSASPNSSYRTLHLAIPPTTAKNTQDNDAIGSWPSASLREALDSLGLKASRKASAAKPRSTVPRSTSSSSTSSAATGSLLHGAGSTSTCPASFEPRIHRRGRRTPSARHDPPRPHQHHGAHGLLSSSSTMPALSRSGSRPCRLASSPSASATLPTRPKSKPSSKTPASASKPMPATKR